MTSDERFELEHSTPRYDPDRVYVRASDTNGHVANVQVPMQPTIRAAITHIVNDPRTPFRNVNDAPRDALYHWMVWWQGKLGDDTPPLVHVAIALADHERREENDRSYALLLDKLDQEARDGILNREVFDAQVQLCAEHAPRSLRRRIERLQDGLEGA